MAHCKQCLEPFAKGEKRSTHECDMVMLDNDHWVTRRRINPGGDLHESLEKGEIKIKRDTKIDPVRSIGEAFAQNKRGPGGAVML
jgi:hypothetical protein